MTRLVSFFKKSRVLTSSRKLQAVFAPESIQNKSFPAKMGANDKSQAGVPLETVINVLQKFAPLKLAETWDNVGLLIEPLYENPITNIMLTNDLTQDVMDEAISKSVNLIISYHPPLFPNIKSITKLSWKGRIISACLAHGIAVYSPHTTWDVIPGGVNDWLAEPFDIEEMNPVSVLKNTADKFKYIITIDTKNHEAFEQMVQENVILASASFAENRGVLDSNDISRKYSLSCSGNELHHIVSQLRSKSDILTFAVVQCDEICSDVDGAKGLGRICKLKQPILLSEAVTKIKHHTKIDHLQIAFARGTDLNSEIKTIAIVAGSGGSPLRNVEADLKITGEASHHDILDSIHTGSSVILTCHSNSERGFLSIFKNILHSKLNDPAVTIHVSTTDKDPLSFL